MIPFEPLWECYRRLIKPNGAIVLFGSQPFTSALVMSNPKWFRYEWVWEKPKATGFLNAELSPLKEHENIVVFYASQCVYNPQMQAGRKHVRNPKGGRPTELYPSIERGRPSSVSNEFYPRTIQRFRNAYYTDGKQVHPTQKPVALLEYLIRTYTHPGELVLDNTAGSFSTGEACVNTGRRFIGIEREPEYCATGQRRIEEAFANHQSALLEVA